MGLTAEEFNRRALESGALTHGHIAELARVWQETADLEVDGKLGPTSLGALEELRELLFEPLPENLGARIMSTALVLGLQEKGEGETDGNNRGKRIDFYRENDGTGMGVGATGAWCATFQSSNLVRAAKQLGVDEAFRLIVNNGEGAGMTIPHLHLHILAGRTFSEGRMATGLDA